MNWQERAEKAEAELARLLEQKPALYMAFSDCGNFIRYWTRDTKNLEATMDVNDFEVLEFYARPIPAPAVPAPEIPDGDDFNGTTPHLIQCIEALVRLDADGVLVPHGIGRDASKLLTAAANRLRKQTAPAVPDECPNCKKAWAMFPIAWYKKRSDGGIYGPLMDDDSRMCAARRKEWTPLYERPFSPDFANYRQGFNDGIEEIRHELKQLCKDSSDLQNRPYMGDVHAQVDAICDRALLQSAGGGK